MDMRPLGRTGLNVSVCCLGTMTYGEQNTEAEGHAQMDRAWDHGVNFLDTAELYAIPPKPDTMGRTEEIIGTWMAARGNRDKVIVATKVVGRSGMNWFRDHGGSSRVRKADIDEAVEKSLRRLQTDYIDLYQIHWPDREWNGFGWHAYADYDDDYTAFEDQLEALDAHVKAGRIRHIGLSNESPWGVMRFLRVAEEKGWPRPASIQNAYNLVNRIFEYGLAEVAMREDVGLLAYSPLGGGHLTGKYLGGARPPGTRKVLFERTSRYEGPGAEDAIADFVALAKEHGLAPEHLALRFAASRPFMTSVIIGATKPDQLETNLAAFDAPITDEQIEAVNALHVRHRNPCP